jgi:hypothetical protein
MNAQKLRPRKKKFSPPPPRKNEKMRVFVKPPTGDAVPLEVMPSDTIESLKARIEGELGIPPDRQRLVFDGAPLDKDLTLADCNVTAGHTIKIGLQFECPHCGQILAEGVNEYHKRDHL